MFPHSYPQGTATLPRYFAWWHIRPASSRPIPCHAMANVHRSTQIESSVASDTLFCVKRRLASHAALDAAAQRAKPLMRPVAQASGAWASIRRDHEAASCDHSSVSTTGLRRAAAGSHRCVGSSSNANRRKRQRRALLAQLGSVASDGVALGCTVPLESARSL